MMKLIPTPSGAIEIRNPHGERVGSIEAVENGIRVYLGDYAASQAAAGPSFLWTGEPFALTFELAGAWRDDQLDDMLQ